MGKWASTFHWQKFVASAAMMWQVTAITAAEGAQLTLVRLFSCVWSHVSFQVPLIGWRKWTEVAAVRFLSCFMEWKRWIKKYQIFWERYTNILTHTCMNSNVLNESCCASRSIVAVAALQLAIIGPLKTINQDPWAVLEGHIHWRMIQTILTAVCMEAHLQDFNLYYVQW